MSTQDFLNACLESMQSKSFYNDYHKSFRMLRADSNALREIVYRLRYEVYCNENGMEIKAESAEASALEQDSYDDRSQHY